MGTKEKEYQDGMKKVIAHIRQDVLSKRVIPAHLINSDNKHNKKTASNK